MNVDPSKPAGRLTIYLGYAPGVGKTYKMIEDGQHLVRSGRDVVIGYFEPHGRQDTIARTEGLEFIARKTVVYREIRFEEMDADAILLRRPAICLVDELAHTNVPGSERAKRWEDVMVLLAAGIEVLTTMNVQHIESLNDPVREITGIAVRETVPDWVVKRADEIVLIDLPPQALLNRLKRGVVYAPEKASAAAENFFKPHTLSALREMAIRQTAHEVDMRQSLPEPAPLQGVRQEMPGPLTGVSTDAEMLLIHVSDDPSTAALIRRGKRVADYLRAGCFAVCVVPSGDLSSLDPPVRDSIRKHLDFARRLQIETRILAGTDAAKTLVDFARQNGVTQILVGKPARRGTPALTSKDFVLKVVRLASDMQVNVVGERRH